MWTIACCDRLAYWHMSTPQLGANLGMGMSLRVYAYLNSNASLSIMLMYINLVIYPPLFYASCCECSMLTGLIRMPDWRISTSEVG